MKNLKIKNIDCHAALTMTKSKSGATQIKFNQAEDALTIPLEIMHDYKCGSATQRGRSMIEMLGVLAIIGVLSVGGIAGYSKAMMKYRINKTIEQITLIAGNIRSFFASQRSYEGLNNSDVIKKAKLVPDEMWRNDSFYFPFDNHTSLISSCSKNSPDDKKAFSINILDVPGEACIELATHDWMIANGYIIKFDREYKKTPLSIDEAITMCGDISDMTFHFDVDINSTYWKNLLNPQ
ncbi:MAG: hypothetical protein IJ525_02800 [Alphaproteobacteria bacterium]|nr:hypothetical protein [Alphaproteobacteria bacterium]